MSIAITLSVHLFSYLMLAGLCVFASPLDLGIAPAPETDAMRHSRRDLCLLSGAGIG